MTGYDSSEDGTGADSPSMLDLVRLSPRLLFPPGGRELYRQIARLTAMDPEDEVLVAGCGNGVTLEYFVTEFGAHGSGVEVDPKLVTAAESRARERELSPVLQFQQAPLDRLPYRDAIFDISIGEIALTAGADDPVAAVRELVRVTRPGGCVVLVQLVWTAPVDETRRRVLADHLGVQPLMLVEWKRMLREAGVQHLHIEDWTDEETAFRPQIAKPFPDFAELFTLPEKLGILRRAWSRYGWSGVRNVLVREREVHRLLTQERILGLDLLKGVKPETTAVHAAGAEELMEAEAAAERGDGDAASEGVAAARATPGGAAGGSPETAPSAESDESAGPASSQPESVAVHGPEPEPAHQEAAPDLEDEEVEGLPLFALRDEGR